MSRWDEQFQNHPIHKTLKEIDNLLSVKTDDISREGQSEKRRISKLMDVFEEVLNALDPELTPRQILDNIHSDAGHVQNELINYNSSRNDGHLKNANNVLDGMLIHLSSLSTVKGFRVTKPAKRLGKLLDESIEATYDKKQSLENEILKVSELSQSQNEKLEALSSSIDTKKQETDSLISSWQTQYSEDQNNRNNSFAEDQQKRMNNFTTWKTKFEGEARAEFDKLINSSNKKITDEQEKFSDKISSLTEDADNKHKQILDLYGLVAGDSVASDYLKNANDEQKQANFWRRATIFFIVLTAAWLITSYIIGGMGANDGSISWERIIKAFSITGILVFGAAYSSKQSSLHRKNEKIARWVSLDMKAFGPFIESLPEEERNSLKKGISERLFGQQYKNTDKGTQVMDEHILKTIIQTVKDVLKN